MKEFIHLFTPVTEGLPEFNERVLCFDGHGLFICVLNENGKWYNDKVWWSVGIVSWANLSKLTTKERAEELAVKAITHAWNTNSWSENKSGQKFINENKHIL